MILAVQFDVDLAHNSVTTYGTYSVVILNCAKTHMKRVLM